ncbi:hypothetical protein VTN00DRAFT_9129 [Thermoascus crustaceus]|uniref:uncharacterized protein n=1 Tax=Thermoascus crustaceus TaxID=5088 RepID=UPI00374373D9
MDGASLAVSVTDIALRVAIQVSRFVQEVRNARESKFDFFLKVETFGDTIDAVRGVLETRKEKVGSKDVDSEEMTLLNAARNTLQFCERTLKKLEEKFRSLDGTLGPGWIRNSVFALRLHITGPDITRLENLIDSGIASLQLLLPCLQVYVHDVSHATMQERLLSRMQEMSNVLRFYRSDPPEQGVPRDTKSKCLDEVEAGSHAAFEDEALEIGAMKECYEVASLLINKMSGCESTTGKTSLPAWTHRHVDPGGHRRGESANSDDITSEDGGVRLFDHSPTSGFALTPDDPSTPGEIENLLPSQEVLTALIDNYKAHAEANMRQGLYQKAETNLIQAIQEGKKREELHQFPFEDRLHLEERLVEAYIQQKELDKAEKIILPRLQDCAMNDPSTRGRLYCSHANLSLIRYHKTKDNISLECLEKSAWRSFIFASNLPSHFPSESLRESARIMKELYKCKGDLAALETFETLYPTMVSPQSANLEMRYTKTSADPPPSTSRSRLPSQASHSDTIFTPRKYSVSTDPSEHYSQEPSSLLEAVKKGNIQVIRNLLLEHADTEKSDHRGMTPLLLAAKGKKTNIIQLLLPVSRVHATDKMGWTVLHHALCGMGKEDMIDSIVEHGADVNAKDNNEATPLHYCVKYGKKEAAGILLRNGADVHARDRAGQDAAMLAVKKKNFDFIELFYHAGVNFDLAVLSPMPKNVRGFIEDLADLKRTKTTTTTSSKNSSLLLWRRHTSREENKA